MCDKPRPRAALLSVATAEPHCYRGWLVTREPRKDLASQADDARLVAAMARGDAQALGRLYDVHAPIMLALANRILGSHNGAEDLVHDVLLEAWRRAADYDPERGSVRAWLMLRTRSRALDVRKSAGVSRTVPIGNSAFIESLSGHDADITLAPDCRAVRRLLEALPDEQRAVLLLGYFEGLTSSEIAARINAPVGTVKSRVAAALTRLRVALVDPYGSP